VQEKKLEVVRSLCGFGADPNVPNFEGMRALHLAALRNDIHSLDFLLSLQEVKVDAKSSDGWTAAHLSCFVGNLDSTSLLLEHGADLLLKHNHGMTAIDEVVRTDNHVLLQCLLEIAKKQPRDLKLKGGFSHLHLAAGSDGSKCLEFLLKQGEFPN